MNTHNKYTVYQKSKIKNLFIVLSLTAVSIIFLLYISNKTAITNAAITDGLVSHWTLDEGAGTTASDSAGANTGTLTNGPVWIAGKIGSGLQFDGTDDYVESTFTNITGYPFTISAWANPTDNLTGTSEVVATIGRNNDQYFSIGFTSSNPLRPGLIGKNSSFDEHTGTYSANVGEWVHIVGIFKSPTERLLYINGTFNSQDTSTVPELTNANLIRIGGGLQNVSLGNNKVDDVRIYNRALTPAEVTELYNSTGGTTPTTDTIPPTRSSGLPVGSLPSGTTSTTLSVTTDEPSTCKYSATAGTSYLAMANTFTTTGSTSHSTTVSGLQNGQSYTYYVRCQDTAVNNNTNDYPISFSVSSSGSPDSGGTPTPTTCTSFTYSAWNTCQSNNTQTRTVTSSSPTGCSGGNPVTTGSCVYVPPTTTGLKFVPQPGSPMALRQHPRLLITQATIPALRNAIATQRRAEFQKYVNDAFTGGKAGGGISESGHDPFRSHILHRAFVYALGDVPGITYPVSRSAFARLAIDELISELNGGSQISHVATLTYDWTYNAMTDAERSQIANLMLNRTINHKVFNHSIASPAINPEQLFSSKYYESFYAWYAALALWGDGLIDAQADNAVMAFYDDMLNYGYLDAQNFAAGQDGGWAEWVGYASWHPRTHFAFINGWRTATGENYVANQGLGKVDGNAIATYPKFIQYAIDPHRYFGNEYTFVRIGGAETTDTSLHHRSMIEQLHFLPRMLAESGLSDAAGLMKRFLQTYNVPWMTHSHFSLWGFLGLDTSVSPKTPDELNFPRSLWSRNLGTFFARTGFNSPSDSVLHINDGHFLLDGHDGPDDDPGFGLTKFGTLINTREVAHRGYGNLDEYPGGRQRNIVYFDGGHTQEHFRAEYRPIDLERAIKGLGDYDNGGIEQVTVSDKEFYHVRTDRSRAFIDGVDHTREYVWIPGNNPDVDSDFLVVYDRTKAPTQPNWVYHVPWKPTASNFSTTEDLTTGTGLTDRIGTAYIGSNVVIKALNSIGDEKDNDHGTADFVGGAGAHGVAFGKTLLPSTAKVEVTRVAQLDGDVLNRQHHLAIKSNRWQVNVTPTQTSTDHRFLNVFETADANLKSVMSNTSLIEAGTQMQGTWIEKEKTGRPNHVVLFNKNEGIATQSFAYTITGQGTTKHIITGLQPRTIYQITDTKTGSTLNVSTETDTQLWDYKGVDTNTETGVITFDTNISGSHTYNVVKSGDAPPPTPTTCTSFTYSAWNTCQSNNTQTRTVTSSSPTGCSGGNPVTTGSCVYVPPTTTVRTISVNPNGSQDHTTIQAGINAAGPGDTVVVAAGTYNESLSTARSGTSNARITVKSAPGATVNVTQSGRVLSIGHSFITIDGLTFDGQFGTRNIVDVSNTSDSVVFRNVEIKNANRDCMDIGASTNTLIENSKIHHCLRKDAGVRIDAHGITGSGILNLTVKNTDISYFSGDAIQFAPSRDFWDNIIIEDSRMFSGPLPYGGGGFNAGETTGENALDTKTPVGGPRSRLTIRNSEFYGFKNGGIDNQAALNLKENIDAIIDRVTIYDGDVALRLRHPANVTISNAVLYNLDRAVRYEDGIISPKIYNFTFGNNINTLFESGGGGTPDVRNSLFLANSKPSQASASSNRTATSADFINSGSNNYRLNSNSTSINTGTTISSVLLDRDGNVRPQGSAYDVGAYEFGGVPPTTNKFTQGDRVQTTTILNVRGAPSTTGTLLGSQIQGAVGTITSGPTVANGFTWWQVNYDNAPDGWSAEEFLENTTTTKQIKLEIKPEGSTILTVPVTLYILDTTTGEVVHQTSSNADDLGKLEIKNLTLSNDTYDVRISMPRHLSIVMRNVSLTSGLEFSTKEIPAGDLNGDGLINSLDWSLMNSKWSTGDSTADINQDGVINTLDWSFVNKNWGRRGE